MILTMRRSDRRDRQLCRFGVMLVVVSLVINMVAVPKAKAVVIDATAAFGAAAATAAINGTTATTLFTGMGTSAATGSVIGMMDTYAVATGVAASGSALASSIATGILVSGGVLLVGAAAAALIGGFIDWMREEEGLEAGGDEVTFYDTTGQALYNGVMLPALPDDLPYSNLVIISQDGYKLVSSSKPFYRIASYGEGKYCTTVNVSWKTYSADASGYTLFYEKSNYSGWLGMLIDNFVWSNHDIRDENSGEILFPASEPELLPAETASLQPKPEFQPIPQEIPEGQVLKIDTGLSSLPADDPQSVADSIMQTAIDGNLAPTVTIEADPTVTPDPDPEPDPDPDGSTETDSEIVPTLPSNLGDLGSALTTRFPFSIPWDIAKAVKLLAAPAKAPYWEIDFMEPIKYRFEDIGDTTITLDFGKPEFEIIGITTRWTSTIGFCLALAAATKRFVWTA